MANQIQQEKIYSRTGLAAGTPQTVTWTGVVHPYDRDNDNDNDDRHSVDITVKNVGATVTGYDVWMTWLTTNKIGDAPVRAGS